MRVIAAIKQYGQCSTPANQYRFPERKETPSDARQNKSFATSLDAIMTIASSCRVIHKITRKKRRSMISRLICDKLLQTITVSFLLLFRVRTATIRRRDSILMAPQKKNRICPSHIRQLCNKNKTQMNCNISINYLPGLRSLF